MREKTLNRVGTISRGDTSVETHEAMDFFEDSPRRPRARSMPLSSRLKLMWLKYSGGSGRLLVLMVVASCAIFSVHLMWRNRLTFTQANIQQSWVIKMDSSLFPVSVDGTRPGEIPEDGNLRYSHMGMLGHLPNSSLAAVFQGSVRYFEGSAEQSLYWSISPDEGMSWSSPQVLVQSEGLPLWSPVLHAEGRRLWLVYSRSSRKCKYFDSLRGVVRYSPGGDIVMTTSDNNGRTWTSPQVVFSAEAEDGIPKVIANKIAVLSNDRWVLPFWREPGKTCPINRNQVPHSQWINGSAGVLISDTQGLSWSVVGKQQLEDSWLIENTVSQTKTGFLLQLFRTGLGTVYQTWSSDYGASWTDPIPTTLPNPNSKVHLMTLSNGYLLVAYNHSPAHRSPLNLALSRDNGRSWRMVGELEADASLHFAYPTIHQTPMQRISLRLGPTLYVEPRGFPESLIRRMGSRLVVIYSVMKSDDAYRLVCLGMKAAVMNLKLLG